MYACSREHGGANVRYMQIVEGQVVGVWGSGKDKQLLWGIPDGQMCPKVLAVGI